MNAILPASVISPRASRSRNLCLFRSVQWLPFRRGDNRCARLPSGSFFRVESIHPKQMASSTISRYGSASGLGVFDLLQATQQNCAERWFCMSHSLSCCLLVKVNRLVTSMTALRHFTFNVYSLGVKLAKNLQSK